MPDAATLARLSALDAVFSKTVSGFRPPENLSVCEWAEKHRRLSPESSAETGPYRASRTPYMIEPMNAFTDPKVKNIVMVAASQIGKSELINNVIGYIIDQDPSSILLIEPTVTDAKEYSKLRIGPMIRDSATLRKKVSPAKSRDSSNTILQKSYPGGILTMCGSTEAHALASKPIRFVLGDERDRWATSAGKEGDPWGLAQARQTTFYNAKSLEVSTPTIKGASAIESAFYTGTQERWCVECPHCQEYSDIVFANIRYEYDTIDIGSKKTFRVTKVYYVCPECGAISTEHVMKHQPAKWIAANPAAYENGIRSFWLNAFVSPWKGWESIILAYLAAIGDTKKMQVVYNTIFGELWEDRGGMEDEDTYLARRETYEAELPDDVLLLTMGVDTQDDRFEYEVVGYGLRYECWGIQKGVIMGRPDSPDTWAALDEVIRHVYRYADGRGLRVSMTCIDEGGHFTQDVRLHCRERQKWKVFAVKGQGGDGIPYTAPPKQMKIVVNGRYVGMCWQYMLGVDAGKQAIMDDLRIQTPGPRYCHFPRNEEKGYNARFFTSLISERLVYKEHNRHPWTWEIIPGHERNEALDCRNYANAACKALHPDFDSLLRKRMGTPEPLSETQNRAVATPNTATQKRDIQSRMKKYYDEW